MEEQLREHLMEDEQLLWTGCPESFDTLDKTNKTSKTDVAYRRPPSGRIANPTEQRVKFGMTGRFRYPSFWVLYVLKVL